MATEQGTVRLVPNKPFCFFRRASGHDVFCHSKVYPKGETLGDGDVVEFEVEDREKGPSAKQGTVKVLSKAVPGSSAPAGQPKKSQQLTGIMVEFLYHETVSDTQYSLEVRVRVTQGNNPLPGAVVELRYFGNLVEMPSPNPMTNKVGEATFLISYYKESEEVNFEVTKPMALSATVSFAGKDASFSDIFPKQTVQASVAAAPFTPVTAVTPVAPVLPPLAPKAQVITAKPLGYHQDTNAYYYEVTTLSGTDPKDAGIGATVISVSSLNLEIGSAPFFGSNFTSVPAGEISTDKNGRVVIGVRLLGSQAQRGNIQFALKDDQSVVTENLFVKTPLPALP